MGQSQTGLMPSSGKRDGARPSTLVVFGDSFSDGGARGYGAGNPLHWRTVYPAEMMEQPLLEIERRFSSKYPFAELGFFECCFSDGLPWPYHLGIADVHNFAHGSGTTCQGPPPGQDVPSGFYPLPSTTGMTKCSETTVIPRGIAQQLEQAQQLLPQDMWTDPSVLFVVSAGANDFLYHNTEAVGRTKEEARDCPTVQNTRQIVLSLKRLGVDEANIILTGILPLEFLPGPRNDPDSDLDWMRSQFAAVNDQISSIGPRRWEMRGFWREAGMQAKSNDCSLYDRLQSFTGPEDLVKKVLQHPKEPGYFDEYHPNLLGHQMIADNFARQFF